MWEQDLAPPGIPGCQLFTETADYSTSAPIDTLPRQRAKGKEEQKEASQLQGIWGFCCRGRKKTPKPEKGLGRKGWRGHSRISPHSRHCCKVGQSETSTAPGRAQGHGVGAGSVRGDPPPLGTGGFTPSSADQDIRSKTLPAPAS